MPHAQLGPEDIAASESLLDLCRLKLESANLMATNSFMSCSSQEGCGQEASQSNGRSKG